MIQMHNIMRNEAFSCDFVLGNGGESTHVLVQKECVDLGSGKGGACSWVREAVAGYVMFYECF